MTAAELTALDWSVLALGGLLIGFSKTAFGGMGTMAAVAFALVLPTRASTGTILPLLLVGDVIAVALYRRHADRGVLLRLLPSLVVGMLVGVAFLRAVDDLVLRRTLGVLLLVLALLQVLDVLRHRGSARREAPEHSPARARTLAALAGGGTGFSTMVANAAGPISSMYLLLMRVPKMAFVGTVAWLFFLLNVVKVPFSAGLGLLTAESLRIDVPLVPAVLVGAAVGSRVLRLVPQLVFERMTLALTAVAAVLLLVT
ncbi:sulfite exporter TauE/SafE family protein [Angustibacter aerolatus]